MTKEIVNYFFTLKGWDDQPKEFYKKNGIAYARHCRPAKQLLDLCDGDLEKAKKELDNVAKWANENGLDYSIETVFKRFLFNKQHVSR